MTVVTTFAFFVPALPYRCLSSNAGARSRRDPWSIADARGILKGEVMDAIIGRANLPHFDRASVTVTLVCTSRRPKATECPRCRLLIAGGDYPQWAIPDRDKPLPCVCYRPKDCGNVGGDPLKPVLDALVWTEIIDDDDWKHVPRVTVAIERVDRLEDEGILVELEGAGT